MATVVRNRERIQATPNGQVWDRYADPTMTRAAREKRIAWRLDHLDEWQRDLEDLTHYDPRYAYDIAHEYDHDWTTDPNYGPRAIDLFEFDDDGIPYRDDARPQAIEVHMRDTVRELVGHRVVYQARYGFVEEIAEKLGLRTRQGRPANTVRINLIVMPSEEDLLDDQGPDRRPRPDDPVPELVLEIPSESTTTRDLDDKRRLYEALGVREYLVYDLGGKRGPGSPRELLLYRLEGEAYQQMAPGQKLSASDPDIHWSYVFGACIRFLPDMRENTEKFRKLPEGHQPPPRFQWWDPEQGRWRDAEIDKDNRLKAEGRVEGKKIERTNNAVDALNEFLDEELTRAEREQVEAVWRGHGPPEDYLQRIKAVLRTPGEWRSLLLTDEPNNDTGT